MPVKIEFRPDGRQKVTTPNQPIPLSPSEAVAELERIRAANRARQQKHRDKIKKAKS